MANHASFPLRLCLGLIDFYQRWISPGLKPSCRYYPSCSAYTKEALIRFGCLKGMVLGMMRLLRCHPWGGCGFDPVPESRSCKEEKTI